jgi:hypothetical protein
MRIIRHRSYTRRMAVLSTGIALFALLAAAALFYTQKAFSPFILAFALLFCLTLLKAFTPWVQSFGSGYLGERRVLHALRALPDDYTAVTNFVVPGSRSGDVDLLVLGPMGVVVVEVKAYPGTILYENGRWWRVQPNGWKTPVKNVSAQARANLRAIVRYLMRAKKGVPALADIFLPASAAMVFVGTERLNTVNPDIPALRVGEFAAHVRSLPPRLTAAQVCALAGLFEQPSPQIPPSASSERHP